MKAEKRLPGRPKLEEEQRRVRFTVRLEPWQLAPYLECARRNGISVGVVFDLIVKAYLKRYLPSVATTKDERSPTHS